MTDRPIVGHPQTPAEVKAEDGHPMVLAYRLGQVERGQADILNKLEMIANNYPTTATLQLLIDPLKEKVRELENKNKDEETARTGYTAQLKLAIGVAVLSPVATIVITLIIVGKGGV